MTPIRSSHVAVAVLLLFGCSGTDEAPDTAELPGGSVTLWTDRSELFMEHPALIVGKASRFAVHLTWVSDFSPVTEGTLSLEFTSASGGRLSTGVDAPSSPGIFRPTATFERPGGYSMRMIIRGRSIDTIHVDAIPVYDSADEVQAEEEPSGGEQEIVFLKEQQWKTDFMISTVRRQLITGTVRAACDVIPKLNYEAVVSAPFTGIIPAEGNSDLPTVGHNVKAGKVLAVMTPSAETAGGIENFSSRYIGAKSDLDLAELEFARSKKLFAGGLISEKEYQEAEAEFREADATYRTLNRFAQNSGGDDSFTAFALRSPISGTIVDARVVPGKHIDAGEELYHIIDASTVWIRANVASTEIGRLLSPDRAWISLAGLDAEIELNEENGRLVSLATAIDPDTRTFPVIFELRNPAKFVRIGMFGEVTIAVGTPRESIVVPESALLEDEGRYSVYVQLGGEAFAKRDVTLGNRNGGIVEILDGVSAGEHVVTTGAYQVRLASLSSQLPAHGHEH